MHDFAIPNDGGHCLYIVPLCRIAALIALAMMLDDCAAASSLFDGGTQCMKSCPAQGTISGDDLEGGHRIKGEKE